MNLIKFNGIIRSAFLYSMHKLGPKATSSAILFIKVAGMKVKLLLSLILVSGFNMQV